MQLKTLQTKLETADINEMSAILDYKAQDVGANRTADYISMSVDNIQSGIDRVSSAINELQAIKKDMKIQQENIKIASCKWLESNGIDKLSGDLISSVTIAEKKPTYELNILNEESVINAGYFKTVIDKTELKNAILKGVNIEGAKLEVTYNEDAIKINKKRKKNEDKQPF